MLDKIIIRGARQHNLKNINLDIPRNKFIVITGISGSGKSSLAFDTIYAEGQRRYVESLSAYARQFLDIMEKPDVDLIDGLSPAISIDQKSVSHNPRSTVGTVTEIYDYLRLLFAKIGVQFCYNCGKRVQKQSTDQIVESILKLGNGVKIEIFAPVVRGRKGHYRELFEKISRDGFLRVRVDGEVREITPGMQVDRYKIHNIEILIDKLTISKESRRRIYEAVELALEYGNNSVIVNDGEKDLFFSKHFACVDCNISYEELSPNSFSFNSKYGACSECNGLGEKMEFDLKLIIPNPSLSISEGAIAPYGKEKDNWEWSLLKAVAKRYDIDLEKPFKKLSKEQVKILLYGAEDEKFSVKYRYSDGYTTTYTDKFDGVINYLKKVYTITTSDSVRQWVERFMSSQPCQECQGKRLKKSSLAVKIIDAETGKKIGIDEIVSMPIKSAYEFFENLKLTERELIIASQILKEIKSRLKFLIDVGLDYLTLDRPAKTLSGGESQRIRLATQIGSQLSGVLYVLDEPSIGLHQRDNIKLIQSLKKLRDLGNTVIVVEHDKETIENADFVIDLGPGAGENGGYVIAIGKPHELDSRSLTAQYLKGEKKIEIPQKRRQGNGKYLILRGATGNNLKNIDVKFPLGKFICITGVSGSGKSTLISETLYRILAKHFYNSTQEPLPYKSIEGIEHIDKVIEIDQSPIGRTPRSNPATYTGVFTFIRDLFSQLPESRLRGYKPGRFSFNVKGGRCEACEGSGVKKIEMHFLPDVYVVCDVCKGKRYNKETLEIRYKGKSISDVLNMTVSEALEFFKDIPNIKRKLQTLHDVGLGYIKLGQPAPTLSGGEAQRVKLATELSKVATGKTLYILDEPTTGLHFEDIKMLLDVLNKLVDKGNTVIVIEHNLEVIKVADWIIDLGPEGGDEGGYIVAEGTPEEVAQNPNSYTGRFLKKELFTNLQ
ncbi:MAG: excinuclease ABC subunit UvrA [Candidatus Kryptonium sp.]|nr:excinuclease ABC subunit UvrA [Candidatus Kryptonium sp.]